MEKLWLLWMFLLISNAEELGVLDEYYLVGLRDLYKFGNVTLDDPVPYAVLAMDFAGYNNLPYKFRRPHDQEDFRRSKAELWPCKGNFSWPVDKDTNVIGAQDFNKNGLLTYSDLLKKYSDMLRLSPYAPYRHREIHVFFSHIPSPATLYAFSLIAKQMVNTTYTLGYYKNAPSISGADLTKHLHSVASDIVKDQGNLNFGRIEGKNSSVEGLFYQTLNACMLKTLKVKQPGYPEPEVFLAKRKIFSVRFSSPSIGLLTYKSEYRKKWLEGHSYYCSKDGNTQLATVEQLKRSMNNGYMFPCAFLADGTARKVVRTCSGKLDMEVCNLEWPREAHFLCSGKKAEVKYIARNKTEQSENIIGEGNQECMKKFGTYLAGVEQLKEAVSVGYGYKSTVCGLTTDGKRYSIIRVGSNDTSLKVVSCSQRDKFGFYCSLVKPKVFREPANEERFEGLFSNANDANEHCRDRGYHLATLTQLRLSWDEGLDYCDCGFLNNGAVMYPINTPRDGCGSYGAGIRQCPRNPRQWRRSGWAAYCSNIELPIVSMNADTGDWGIAMETCKINGRGLARFEHYMDAFNQGFRDERCLVSANGQSYTFTEVVESCSNPTSFYCTRYQVPVFHLNNTNSNRGYDFANKEAAERACNEKGSTLATENLLELAFQLGYDQCSCGFLRGGQVRYPINRPREGCGDVEGAGLRDCPISPSVWSRSGWDAYCVTLQT